MFQQGFEVLDFFLEALDTIDHDQQGEKKQT